MLIDGDDIIPCPNSLVCIDVAYKLTFAKSPHQLFIPYSMLPIQKSKEAIKNFLHLLLLHSCFVHSVEIGKKL